jgi:integrase
MGLGTYPDTSMEKARAAAEALQKLVAEGIDPHDHRQQQEAARKADAALGITFKESAEDYIKARGSKWRNEKHAWQWGRTLEMYAYPLIGEKSVTDITTADILSVLQPIWTKKGETAARLRNRIEMVLNAAATKRDDTRFSNPARWRNHLENWFDLRPESDVDNHPAMEWKDVPGYWSGDLAEKDSVTARALRLTILCASRTGEVLGARWSEFDVEAKVWCIPASRMKSKRQHRVPLTDQAIQIIESQRGQHPEFVFPGRNNKKPLSQPVMLNLLKETHPKLSVHGFRSSFRTWVEDTRPHLSSLGEAAIAHSPVNKIERKYQRSDLLESRRALMADWASFVTTKPGGNVIQLPRREAAS